LAVAADVLAVEVNPVRVPVTRTDIFVPFCPEPSFSVLFVAPLMGDPFEYHW
jgi:hypothetical protein